MLIDRLQKLVVEGPELPALSNNHILKRKNKLLIESPEISADG